MILTRLKHDELAKKVESRPSRSKILLDVQPEILGKFPEGFSLNQPAV